MFAIALWDRAAERLVLARDRLGKKPLVYAQLPDGSLAFASETKALLRLPALPRTLDLTQIDAFLALQYAPRSGFEAVEKVPPGSFAVAEHGRVRIERYWRPAPAAGVAAPTRNGSSVFAARSMAAVRRRLVADVPLGALLSGGLDSSIVVAAMAGACSEPVRTFTIGFPDRRYDERAHARAVAERFGTRHEELEVDPGPELLERVAAVFDEPLGDEAALPMLLVCDATRQNVKAALVGDGGDEAFGGYERYRAHALGGPGPAAGGRRGRRGTGADPGRPALAALHALSGPPLPRRGRPASAPSGTPASSRYFPSSFAAGSGATRPAPTRRGRSFPAAPTCASSTSSRTFRATCCRSRTSPRWPPRWSSAPRSSTIA